AKRGKATWHLHGIRAQMRAAFPSQLYRQRAIVESVFSAAKRKLSACAPGRSSPTQERQALLLGIAFNVYRLRPSPVFLLLGCQQGQMASEHITLEWRGSHERSGKYRPYERRRGDRVDGTPILSSVTWAIQRGHRTV